ncbi:MAG: SPOR domain-containing protein [Pseudomonadota bacterium]
MVDDTELQEEPANIMDEAIKDRTVTRIAMISIVAVGLLGLWVIGGALRSSGLPWVSQGASLQLPPTSPSLPALPPPPLPATPAGQSPPSIAPPVTGAGDVTQQQAGIVHITGAQPAVAAHATPPAMTMADSTEVFVSQPLIPTKKSSGAQHFGVQLGVFNTVANAEKLRQKMQAQGVPVVVEARVHVGPFATRAEAEEARAKLKALGIEESVLVMLK